MLSRRSIFARAFASLAGLPLVAASTASAAVPAGQRQKVVYHLSDLDKVGFVLGNIDNHIKGKGGPDKVDIVLVVHGPALKPFVAERANPDTKQRIHALTGQGLRMAACGNTLKGLDISLSDLVSGFELAAEGGVVRIADLQEQGYLYLHP